MSTKVDFHVHVTPPEIGADWQKYAENEPHFTVLCQSPRNKFACAEDVITELDAAGFDKAVIFGFGFKDPGLCRTVNDYVIEKTKQFPEKLIGFIAVSPNAKEIEKEIDRCYSAGLKGVGEIFPGSQFDLDNEKETCAIATACTERNLPLIIHVNEPVGHFYPGKIDMALLQIEHFIENNPNLRIVLAHWGGGLMFYEAMPELRQKFRNVYYDTAATPFLYGPEIYRAALELGLGEKIIFGSDFPLLPISRYLPPIEALPPKEREGILGGNAIQMRNEQ
jgi:predicted TIM-barrel fold metal-dependent hydrolase